VTPWDDLRHMARAMRLARRGLYTTDPNPRVGCVLVRDGEVVGEGFHRRAGEPHAERNAIDAAGEPHAAPPPMSRSSPAAIMAARRPAPMPCSRPASRASWSAWKTPTHRPRPRARAPARGRHRGRTGVLEQAAGR
jgi:hypothetical protein